MSKLKFGLFLMIFGNLLCNLGVYGGVGSGGPDIDGGGGKPRAEMLL